MATVSTQITQSVKTGATTAQVGTRSTTAAHKGAVHSAAHAARSAGQAAAHATQATAHATVHAARTAATAAPTTVSLPGLLLQVIIALGVIILFVWLVSKAARSRAGRMLLGGAGITGGGMFGAFGGKKQAPIQVVSRQMLGKGMSLVIVEVEGKLLMLGVTQHNISVLADLTEESGEDAVGITPDSFGSMLSTASAAGQPFYEGSASAARSASRFSPRSASGSPSVPVTDKSNISPIDFLRELTVRRSVGR